LHLPLLLLHARSLFRECSSIIGIQRAMFDSKNKLACLE
jgi:hypothetical protein